MSDEMLNEIGFRAQESLRENPAVVPLRTFAYPLRGTITNVVFRDATGNQTGQTLVDINLHGGRSNLVGVPIAVAKANATTGEEWTPEKGDIVVVQFLNGQWNDPVVTSFMNMPGNAIQATTTNVPSSKRRYHMRCNKTDVVIDKDGHRTTHVEGNETVTIKNSETVTVQLGDITIDVVEGKCTVHIKGKTAWQSEGTIDMDGTNTGAVKGIVQGDCICPLIRRPHLHISASVKGSK